MLISYIRYRVENVFLDGEGTIRVPPGSSYSFSTETTGPQVVHSQSTWVIAGQDPDLTSYLSVGKSAVSLISNFFSPNKRRSQS